MRLPWPLTRVTLPRLALRLTSEQRAILITSQVMALVWWAFILAFHFHQEPERAWFDQIQTFTQAAHHLDDPYVDPRFVYPVWAALPLIPFGHMPLEMATLIEISIFFGVLALFIIRHEGTRRTALVVFTSCVAFDAALELNIEWIVALGLIVPVEYSLPFLLVKPQIALGYLARYATDVKTLVRAGLVLAVVLLASFLVWGFWPTQWLDQIGFVTGQEHNDAPSVILPRLLSYALGLPLVVLAIRRRDGLLGIMAWVFFVPYFAYYSGLILFTCFALKLRRSPMGELALWGLAYPVWFILWVL